MEIQISYRFKFFEDNFVWVFIGVYGLIHGSEREELWAQLVDIKRLWDDPCFVCVSGEILQ